MTTDATYYDPGRAAITRAATLLEKAKPWPTYRSLLRLIATGTTLSSEQTRELAEVMAALGRTSEQATSDMMLLRRVMAHETAIEQAEQDVAQLPAIRDTEAKLAELDRQVLSVVAPLHAAIRRGRATLAARRNAEAHLSSTRNVLRQAQDEGPWELFND